MEYFTARDEKPAEYCKKCVRECDVYIGLIGLRYGSPVRDRPDVSYTELEFESATEAPALTRLVFLLDPNSSVPVGPFTDLKHGTRQDQFRKRLSDAGVTCRSFSDAHELETLIYQALKEDEEGAGELSPRQVRIDWPEGTSPYRGLLWFNQDYAPLFFGRDREVDELISKMSEPGGRAVLVIGASGSGKSSVVAAGIRQAVIKQGRLPGSTHWKWHRIQPSDGDTPSDALARGLKEIFQLSARPRLTTTGTTLRDLLTQHLSQGQELIIFVDQFEELFTGSFNEPDIQTFLEHLIGTAQDQTNRLRVIATIRNEFLGKLHAYPSTLNVLNSSYQYHLGPVSPRMLQEMIEKPAKATGYQFEPGLVERILQDTGQEPGNLALVEYALKQLFERRTDRTFTLEAYEAIGGVVGAIATKANEVLSGLEEEVRGSFDRVFAELLHLERERPPTRRRAIRSTFSSHQAAINLIDALAGQECRVLVTSGTGQEAVVEVAHEKLFTAWPELKDWIEKSGEALRDIDHAEVEARRWQKGGDNPHELWLGNRAKKVLNALEQFGKSLSPELERFLKPHQLLLAKLEEELSHQERLLIGQTLAEFGDTRPGVGVKDGVPDIVWIDIPGGRVKLEDGDHVFEVKPFRMAKYPVTNAQFAVFITATDGYRNEEWWKGIEQSEEACTASWHEANAPRETVSWYEAVAFCRWLSHHRPDQPVRLPTEWEWQQAATGGDPEREYPWEGGRDGSRCNSYESRLNRTTAVGMYPQGATQQGVLDMMGNVWEWCVNKTRNPERLETMRIDKGGDRRVIRGGSWDYRLGRSRVSLRNGCDAGYRGAGSVHLRETRDDIGNADSRDNGILGFRLALDLS
jgi:formylglycine-generating enzyme required for sulfatase activity